jgi:hypothetical protein
VAARSYEVVTSNRLGRERVHRYATDDLLEPGSVIRLGGRDLLIADVDEHDRAIARPARYRLRLDHGGGRVELGAMRRWRPDAPTVGHTFRTLDGSRAPVEWEVRDERLATDAEGDPYVEFVAERAYDDPESRTQEPERPAARQEVSSVLARADREGLSVELVVLETGDEPDWDAAARLIDSLVLEELEDDLIELAGVDPDADPRDTWLEHVKERLRADLESFRGDVEGEHDQIEEWELPDGRILASVGRESDEAVAASGHGWMVRLLDAEALGAAGFKRVRKAELDAGT